SDIKLTMNVYTDPKLLDVHGALEALPQLPLDAGDRGRKARGTGTEGQLPARTLAQTLAQTPDNSGPGLSSTGNPPSSDLPNTIAVSACPVNEKGRLSSADNRPSCRGDWIRTSDLLNPIQAR